MTRDSKSVALLALAALAWTACSKKPTPEPPAPQAEAPTTPAAPAVDRDAEERARAEARRAEELARMRAVLTERVYFDYDQFSIRTDARTALEAKVPFLRGEPSIRLRIEGHADERGSDEYNLALGMRRANAVKGFLVGYGLDASRFEVRSFGEERPADSGSNEAAWARNRRAEFVVTAGPIAGNR